MEDRITTSDVKKINKNRIIKLIHYAGKISRQEIADILGLSLPTVNHNLKSLKEENLIEITGSFDSTGGRKAQVIVVNEHAKSAINITLKNECIIAAAINFNGKIIASRKVPLKFSDTDEYARTIGRLVDAIIQDNHINTVDILGVGITVPGIFDKSGDVILAAPTIHIFNYEVNKLKKYIKYPCVVMNDAKSAAYAETWIGEDNAHQENSTKVSYNIESDTVSKSVYLYIDDGVGGSINSGYREFKGINNRAGEFGHMTIVPDGRECECGKKGCLEAYISTRRISSDLGITLEEFFQGVDEGYAKYEKIFDEYLDMLAISINSIYSIFDTTVVVGGPIVVYLEKYVSIIMDKLSKRGSFSTDGSYFKLSKRRDMEAAIGAALIFVGEYIEMI